MRSDTIHVTNGGPGLEAALEQTERVAKFKGLEDKSALHLRLLTEEMMGVMRALTGEKEGDFWIEDNEHGVFSLHLLVKANMDYEMRKRLLAVSSSGTNSAAKGITGKLRDLFERLMAPGDITLGSELAAGLYCVGVDPEGAPLNFNPDYYWSLQKYSEAMRSAAESYEAWDELESSVIARLADDVRIGIVGQNAEMTVIKQF